MSYYEKDSTVTLTWKLHPTANPPLQADLDIILELPDNTGTYNSNAASTYTAPTATADGEVTYDLTLSQVGKYIVELVTGTDAAFTRAARRELYSIVVPDHVKNGIGPLLYQGPGVNPPAAPSWASTGHTMSLLGETQAQTIAYMNNGNKISFAGLTLDTLYVVDLATPFDISNVTYNFDNRALAGLESAIKHHEWKPDGTKFFTSPTNTSGFQWLKDWTAGGTWQAASSTLNGNINGLEASNEAFRIRPTDGQRLYVLDRVADIIHQHNITTAWSPLLGTTDGNQSFTPPDGEPCDFKWNGTGTRLYVLYENGTVGQYPCSSAWNLNDVNNTATQIINISATCPAPIAFDIWSPTDEPQYMVVIETTGTDVAKSFVFG